VRGVSIDTTWLSIAQSAPLMGLSRRRTRERLIEIDRTSPHRGLLSRPGGPLGDICVNAEVLRAVILESAGHESNCAPSRLGLVESDVATLRARVRKTESELSKLKSLLFGKIRCLKSEESAEPNTKY
jgi:hypothetical protein